MIPKLYLYYFFSFGENTVRNVLYLWNDKKEDTTNALVEFLLLQLVIHHPGGVSDDRDGAMHKGRIPIPRKQCSNLPSEMLFLSSL